MKKSYYYQKQIVLTIGVTGKMNTEELQEMGQSVAEHLLETFNDNDSIQGIHVDTKKVKVRNETE